MMRVVSCSALFELPLKIKVSGKTSHFKSTTSSPPSAITVRQSFLSSIHFFLSLVDKRLALKARLFKTVASTISLLRIYSYNAKVAPVLLTLLKIYAKNGKSIWRSLLLDESHRFPLFFVVLSCHRIGNLSSCRSPTAPSSGVDARSTSCQITKAINRRGQTFNTNEYDSSESKRQIDILLRRLEKLAARATSTTIVRDLLAVVFLMDKSQGQNRIRTIKIKEGLLKVLLNLVKSSTSPPSNASFPFHLLSPV